MWAKKLRVLLDKMVGSNQTLIAIRMVRSKLRKREESNNNSHNQSSRNPGPGGPGRLHGSVVHPQAQDGAKGVVLAPTAAPAQPAVALNGQSQLANGEATPVSPTAAYVAPSEDGPQEKADPVEVFLWSNPTNRSTCGTQLSLYSGDQDTLVHTLPCEEPRECKGFRKNLRGKWKRLVKKKQPGPDVYAIPPELRDQLKQIYVY